MCTVAYEVTLRIVRPNSPASTQVVAALAEVVRVATDLPQDSPDWQTLGDKLRAGTSVRVCMGPVQFCNFFLGRRAAGPERYRLKWSDAVQVRVPAEVVA